jgi:hypothetical protein
MSVFRYIHESRSPTTLYKTGNTTNQCLSELHVLWLAWFHRSFPRLSPRSTTKTDLTSLRLVWGLEMSTDHRMGFHKSRRPVRSCMSSGPSLTTLMIPPVDIRTLTPRRASLPWDEVSHRRHCRGLRLADWEGWLRVSGRKYPQVCLMVQDHGVAWCDQVQSEGWVLINPSIANFLHTVCGCEDPHYHRSGHCLCLPLFKAFSLFLCIRSSACANKPGRVPFSPHCFLLRAQI